MDASSDGLGLFGENVKRYSKITPSNVLFNVAIKMSRLLSKYRKDIS
jgi:hypothetical protein